MDDTIRAWLRNILSGSHGQLDSESLHAIEHYIQHDEFEMAGEILLTEIMNKGIVGIDTVQCLELGKQLKLDQETVYDPDFWPKFEKFATNSN